MVDCCLSGVQGTTPVCYHVRVQRVRRSLYTKSHAPAPAGITVFPYQTSRGYLRILACLCHASKRQTFRSSFPCSTTSSPVTAMKSPVDTSCNTKCRWLREGKRSRVRILPEFTRDCRGLGQYRRGDLCSGQIHGGNHWKLGSLMCCIRVPIHGAYTRPQANTPLAASKT